MYVNVPNTVSYIETIRDVNKCWLMMPEYLRARRMCLKLNIYIELQYLPRLFSRFFAQKIKAFRAATAAADPPVFTPCPKPCTFESFKPLSQDQILFLI